MQPIVYLTYSYTVMYVVVKFCYEVRVVSVFVVSWRTKVLFRRSECKVMARPREKGPGERL